MNVKDKLLKAHLFDEIVETVSWCETVQDSPESRFCKEESKKIAYKEILEIVNDFLDQESEA